MAVGQVPLLNRSSPGSAEMILGINSTHANDAEPIWKVVAAVHDLTNHRIDHVMFVYFKLVRFALCLAYCQAENDDDTNHWSRQTYVRYPMQSGRAPHLCDAEVLHTSTYTPACSNMRMDVVEDNVVHWDSDGEEATFWEVRKQVLG